ncbi:alpha/beta hydrolase [Companilactobacillus sp. RD055328]|uniref:alpha/beta hydrolase n=1 Tax=Companilactobacillus sp. RD055328 TaxID=2916634 RepID=UPI001FC7CD7A|nr:alpha/beta hydrolase [Companilactobacillus sp. RD055328]GKQ42453.1 alpha/beta hydrolase [Companilactobacillus sp. RD055328]
MIYVLLAILLIGANLTIVIKKIFEATHIRDSKALGSKEIIFPESHPLYKRTAEFKELPHEIWSMNRDGLELKAFYYEQKKPSDKTIILVHGFGATHNSLNIFGQLFYQLGFNVLMPDNRAAGISEGKYMSFGFHEKTDVLAWIDQLNEKISNQKIVLFGASMGAATILQTLSLQLPNNVVALIEDSSYIGTSEIIEFHANKKVGKIAKLIVPLLSAYSKIKLGFWYSEASPQQAIKNSNLPIMFIAGGKDQTVPPIMSKKLYDSYQGPKDFYENPQGIHIRSYNQDPPAYEFMIKDFLKKYI